MRSFRFRMSILLIAILAGCSAPVPSPVVPQEEIDKALSAILTQAAGNPTDGMGSEASPTSEPALPSVAPTATLLPSQTPYPTSTPFPTITPFVLPTATPAAILTAKPNPKISILGVQENTAVSVQAYGFSPNQVLKIRMGPYETFSANAVEVGTINTGQGGSIKFTALLPGVVKGVEKVTIRLDGSAGEVAYTYFSNETSGTAPTVSATVTSAVCEVSVSPSLGKTMNPGDDFDAVWTVKNISGKTWDLYSTDYKYISGTKLQKYASAYDLDQAVKPGGTITLQVDMLAPTDSGTYSTTWALVQGNTVLCTLPVKIVVK